MQSNCKLWFGVDNTMKDGYIDEQNDIHLIFGYDKMIISDRTFKLLKITVYPG